MKKRFIKIICALLAVLMTTAGAMQIFAAEAGEGADYSISPDYAARYPHGVIEFHDAKITVDEGSETELKLIRMGGTEGKVTVMLKAVDISAKFGVDYDVKVGLRRLRQDKEYTGTLIENYLEESGGDYITSDDMLTDEVYKQIIGYKDADLSDEEAAELCGASVGLISDTLGVSEEKAMELVGLTEKTEERSADTHYTSPLHELKDSVLGEKTAANGMDKSDMLNMDGLIGNNDENLAASAITDAAIGASLTVTFNSGENEKTITIRTKDDAVYESQEVFTLGICNPTGGAELGEFINSAIVINDNDETEKSVIGFNTSSVTVGSDEAAASVDIVRTGCINDYAEIKVRTVSNSAIEGEDYLPVNATSVFLPGEKKKTVIVPLKTSVKDQTEAKTLDVVLSCEADGAEIGTEKVFVTAEPKKASSTAANSVVKDVRRPSYYGPAIIMDIEKAKRNTDEDTKDHALLFNSPEDIEDSLYMIAGVEIDVTQLNDYAVIAKHGTERLSASENDAVNFGAGRSGVIGNINFLTNYYDNQAVNDTRLNRISLNYARGTGYPYSFSHLIMKTLNKDRVMTWDEIQINEIRLYPYKVDFIFKPDHNDPNQWNWQIKSALAEAEYRVFNGTGKEDIVNTKKLNVGTVRLPDKIYRGWVVSEASYTPSAEIKKRGIYNWGYVLYHYNIGTSSRKFTSITKKNGSVLTASDLQFMASYGRYITEPIFRSDDLDYITVEQYNEDHGVLKIGGKVYNGEEVASTEWRVGDELIMTVEPMHGFKCGKIQITRADGTEEFVDPGDPVMLTKGMKVKPQLYEEDISVTFRWAYAGVGEYEDMDKNLSGYSFTSDHEFTDNGDGTFTFNNMTPGDVVTVYSIPKNQGENGYVSDHTGWWLRTVREGETRMSDDMRYIACVGDAYAFRVDDHDMTFNYYLIKKDVNAKGALVTGRVVTNGGTIKRPSTVVVTAKNVDQVGTPVFGAMVSVLSTDINDRTYVDGEYYYTSGQTDKNGYFTVYLPGYAAGGLGYCISISVNNKVYQNITSYQANGVTVFQVPYQDPNFQIDRMTLGSDMNTTEIALTDTDVKIGAHVVTASGYRAQRMVFRSYDGDGTLVREWAAVPSTAADWNYETTFKPSEYLRESGRLTVEIYDQYDRGQGEFNTGYGIRSVPKTLAVTLPQFDPKQSVNLPVIGNMTSMFDLGSSSKVKPEDANKKSATDISGAGKDDDTHYLEITFGASNAIKAAVKAAKKDKGYKSMNASARASLILSKIKIATKSDQTEIYKIDDQTPKPEQTGEAQDTGEAPVTDAPDPGDQSVEPAESNENNKLENESKVKSGEGKNSLVFNYALGVYMSLYTKDGKCYFEDMTLYANLSITASSTQQFYVYGIPIYLKLSGELTGELLVHTDPVSGEPLEIADGAYFNDEFAKKMQATGVFHIKIKCSIGTGVGNPKFLSAGVSGTLELDIDYQPWKDGAGIVSFSFDAEATLLAVKIKYNLFKTSYGMFKSSGYTGTLDFSKVKNADKFKKSGGKKQMLLSYRDANSETEIYGSIEPRERSRSLNEKDSSMIPESDNSAYNLVLGQNLLSGVTDTVTPVLMPIKDGRAALYLRLDDDSTRGDKDFSSVAYSIINWNGYETEPVYLDNDNTFDSDLTAAVIGDGRILVVWSDLDRSLSGEDAGIGESLNHADLSYCIFDKNGVPGEIKKLTNENGCDRMPTIAYDEKTNKTFIVYTVTDYQTEGVSFGEDNLEELGNFIYNSYSTVCFKVLDENGEIITGYTSNESCYSDYEQQNGVGSLNGMRYLNTQKDNSVSQATIDELSAAANDGKVYVSYSLDTDKNTTTDADREICVVECDLSSMIQSEPLFITENVIPDTHPQIVSYDGHVLLFWNKEKTIVCLDLTDRLDGDDETEHFSDLLTPGAHSNAASSFYVTVQPNNNLSVVWTDWYKQGDELLPAVFYREYDPQFRLGTGDETDPYTYGSWGSVQKLVTAKANQDITEITYLDVGRTLMLCFKYTNKDEEGRIVSYDSFAAVLEEGNSVDFDFDIAPEYPLPGETATITVRARNTGSLPTEKVTVKTELIDKNGKITPIDTKVFEEHYQSNGVVDAVFDDFVCPDDPQDCRIRVTAWENDMSNSAYIKEFDLPYGAAIDLSDVELNKRGDNGYVVSADAENKGNRAFDGKLYVGFHEQDGANGKKAFAAAADGAEIGINAKEIGHGIIFFEVPDDRYDDEGVCELDLIAVDPDGNILADQLIKLHKPADVNSEPKDIRMNTAEDSLTIPAGKSVYLDAAVTPYTAQSGYRVVYSVDDPSTASVDASGVVTANKTGKTTLTVSAVKNQTSLFINSDGRILSEDGALVIDDNGRITNLAETEKQTPSITKKITLTVTKPVAGDCSGDGELDNKDVVLLFKYVSSGVKADDETVYDFNGDGEVNNKDVIALFRFVSRIAKTDGEKNDLNGDGEVNNKDVVLLFRYVSSGVKAEDETAYDINGDGEVNNKDVIALFRFVSRIAKTDGVKNDLNGDGIEKRFF